MSYKYACLGLLCATYTGMHAACLQDCADLMAVLDARPCIMTCNSPCCLHKRLVDVQRLVAQGWQQQRRCWWPAQTMLLTVSAYQHACWWLSKVQRCLLPHCGKPSGFVGRQQRDPGLSQQLYCCHAAEPIICCCGRLQACTCHPVLQSVYSGKEDIQSC